MKKIFNKLAVLLGMLAGLGFFFSACAVSGSGVSDDEVKVPSAGDSGSKGELGQLTEAQIVEKFPNQYMFRYNGKSDDQFSDAAPYSITDFGKDDTNGVFRYYPTPVDLTSDTGEFSAVVNGNNISGKQGIGFVQIQDNKVIGWWLVTTGNKIRYLNPKNTVSPSKTTENGSGWDTTTLTDGKFAKDTNYTVKIALKGSITSTSSADNGQRGFEVDVFDAAGTKVANKAVRYPVWMTPDSDSKIYFAIGTMGNDSAYTTWSNVTVKINNGETYTMKKIVNTQDQSSMTVKDESGNAVKSVLVSAGKTITYKYSARDKDGSEVEPKVTVTPEGFATVTVDKNAKTISIAAGSSEGTGKVTVVNEAGTGKPSVEITVEVAVTGTVKLNGNVVADLETAFAGLDATTGGNITLSTGSFIVQTGKQLKYTGNGNVTITGEGTADYGADVKIIGNPNTGTQNSRELMYFTGNSDVTLKNLTVVNKFIASTDCQAEALASNGNGHIIAENCTFDSHQDTIRTTGKAWFYKCHIKGDVDFIWMEQNGTVALYEDCKITCVADRKSASYIVAPRSKYTTDGTIGKGVVILDSKIYVEDFKITDPAKEGAFLFRSPWYSETKNTAALAGCYNNAAFVNTTVESGSLNTALLPKPGLGIGDNSVVGWKTDSKFAAANVGTISSGDLSAEYDNRGYILNHLIKINGTNTSYVTDETAIWDVKDKIAAAETKKVTVNPTVSAFDPTNATVIWDFTSDLTSVTDGGAVIDNYYGFNQTAGTILGYSTKDTEKAYGVKLYADAKTNKGKINYRASYNGIDDTKKGVTDTQFNAGSILTIPVTAGAKVTVSLKSPATGIAIENDVKTASSSDITYTHGATASASEVIFYSTSNIYLSEVKVEGLNISGLSDDLKNATATGSSRAVKITASTPSINSGKTSTFAATVYPSYGATPSTVTWSATGSATVSEAGVVTANPVTTDETAKVTATIGSTLSDSVDVAIKAVAAGSTSVTWLTETSYSVKGVCEDNTIVDMIEDIKLTSTNSETSIAGGTNGDGCLRITMKTQGTSIQESEYVDFAFTPKVAVTVTNVSYKHGEKASSDKIFTEAHALVADNDSKTFMVVQKKNGTLNEECSISVSAGTKFILRVYPYQNAGSSKYLDIGKITIDVKKQ